MRRFDARIQQLESQLYIERDARGSVGRGKEQRSGQMKIGEFPGRFAQWSKNQASGVADLVKSTPGAIADFGRDVGDIVTSTPDILRSVAKIPGALSNIGKSDFGGINPSNPLVQTKNYVTSKVNDIRKGVNDTADKVGNTLTSLSKGEQIFNPSTIGQGTPGQTSVAGQAIDTARSGARVADHVASLTNPSRAARDIAINSLTSTAMDDTANSLINKTKTASPDERSPKPTI